jgi:hypothetical protein
MDKTETHCHTYFSICSNGEVKHQTGFVANENSEFDPDYITQKLGIQPYEIRRMGCPRKNGHGTFPFSEWSIYQDSPALDAGAQCLSIVDALYDKIPVLLDIKREFDVAFTILVVPHIYNEISPYFGFNKRIIEFCYLTGAEISIDMYVYDREQAV